jgi:hypothetical protein
MQPEDDTSEYWSNTPLRSSLFLLEDYANKDNENPGFVSAYSSLLLLMNAAFQQIQLTSVAFDLAAINEKDFLRDPVTALRRLGALPGREREISALYKVLNSTVQGHAAKRKTEDSEMITVGYAIAICEGKTDFDKR